VVPRVGFEPKTEVVLPLTLPQPARRSMLVWHVAAFLGCAYPFDRAGGLVPPVATLGIDCPKTDNRLLGPLEGLLVSLSFLEVKKKRMRSMEQVWKVD